MVKLGEEELRTERANAELTTQFRFLRVSTHYEHLLIQHQHVLQERCGTGCCSCFPWRSTVDTVQRALCLEEFLRELPCDSLHGPRAPHSTALWEGHTWSRGLYRSPVALGAAVGYYWPQLCLFTPKTSGNENWRSEKEAKHFMKISMLQAFLCRRARGVPLISSCGRAFQLRVQSRRPCLTTSSWKSETEKEWCRLGQKSWFDLVYAF